LLGLRGGTGLTAPLGLHGVRPAEPTHPITMNTATSKRRRQSGAATQPQQPPQEVVDRLAALLPEGALDEAVRGLRPEELSGPGGLLSQLAGRVVEAALEAEMTDHL